MHLLVKSCWSSLILSYFFEFVLSVITKAVFNYVYRIVLCVVSVLPHVT